MHPYGNNLPKIRKKNSFLYLETGRMSKARILCYMTPPPMIEYLVWELGLRDIDKFTLIYPSQEIKSDDETNILR